MKTARFLILLLIAISVISCSPNYYIPNSHNVPLLSEKGEFAATAAAREGQADIQATYAVGDHVGIMANSAFFFPKEKDGNGGSGRYFEAGAGYFTPVSSNGFIFETYGLLGVGSMENHFTSSDDQNNRGRIEAQLFRAGVQPAIGYKSEYFSAAISTRLAYLNYSSVEGDLIFDQTDQIRYLQDHNNHLLFEPALTLRGGLEKIKLQLQIGTSINLSHSDFRQGKEFLTLGLLLNLPGN